MILSAHQPNLCPWIPYFAKMAQSDIFILMVNCQFEKNGYQNRFNCWDKWVTLPVINDTSIIKNKMCVNGNDLVDVSIPIIMGFANMFGIDTSKVHIDFETSKTGTDRIIELCKKYECDQYLTNPDAINKYLDEKKLNKNGIELVPFNFPYKKPLFEALQSDGIDGITKMIHKKHDKIRTSSIPD